MSIASAWVCVGHRYAKNQQVLFEIQRCHAPLETITKEDMTNGRPQGVCELRGYSFVLDWQK
jgi:hypothetical protein